MKTATTALYFGAAALALQPVADLDLDRYDGKWFQVRESLLTRRVSDTFAGGACICPTANYTPQGSLSIAVTNDCFREDGDLEVIEGSATVLNPVVPTAQHRPGGRPAASTRQGQRRCLPPGIGKRSVSVCSRR